MSTIRVNNITDTSGGSSSLSVPGAAKAWVNFNGTGTIAIRAQLNVSSITDNGVGDYTVNFTTAMTDANYSFVATSSGQNGVRSWHTPSVDTVTTPTASLVRIGCVNTSSAREDDPYIFVTVHR